MTSKNNYDFIIIGAGGTGLAAGMYAARLGLKTLVLGASHGTEMPVGGVITTTNVVENYPGFIKTTGEELAKKLEDHTRSYGLVTIKEEKATEIKKLKSDFKIKTPKDTYEAKTILFATGTKWRKLPDSVKGSTEFENKGVAYCALCQPPEEDIIANSNVTQIGEVTPTTRVLTMDGTYQKIAGFHRSNFEGNLISITPRFFTEPTTLTPNHPILTVRADRGNSANYKTTPDFSEPEWKEASEIDEKDCVLYPIIKETQDKKFIKIKDFLELRTIDDKIMPRKKTHTAKLISNEIKLTPNLMRLFGYFIAEGSASGHNLRFYFHKDEKEYLDDVSRLIEESFGLKPQITYRKSVGIVSLYNRVIADFFKILFDKYAHSKSIPHFMMLLPEEKQKELIKGLFRGDGCVRDKDFCYVTTSKKLTYQMRDILLRLGIIPSVQIRKNEILNEKRHKLEGRDISFTKDKYHLNVGGQFLEKMSEILGIDHKKLKYRKNTLKHAWIKDNFAILPIRKIEKRYYDGEVLSIGVEETSSYVTKSFIVHNCDAPLFKNKTVAVIGGSDSAAKDALLLSEHAKKVYIIYRGEEIHPEPINLARIKQNKKIEVINNTNLLEIKGEQFVKSVTLDRAYKGKKELSLDGVFVAIGHIILSDLAKELGVKTNKKGEIITDKEAKTNLAGVFAAGDVADTPFKQLITGVAEGCIAAHSAYEFINKERVETS